MDRLFNAMLAGPVDPDTPECPDCGSVLIDVSGGKLFPDETMTCECVCHNCQLEWQQQHTLKDIQPDMPYIPCFD